MPIAYDATLRHYREGHAGLVAEALEQPLLLSQDMEAYRTFNHPELFLSLKRDLAMVSNYVHFSSFVLISLHFIAKVIFYYYYYLYFFYFLGHTASFCGRGMDKELPQRDKACPGCLRRSRGAARRVKRKTSKNGQASERCS